ncbi:MULTISPECIES: ABC transporter permease [Amycolatopsis]|uniref:Transport permease protein n=1 Tax=Amycolatopsis albidoflavus TaxID=102226 RepID=A0ABW5I969_9PSEU
MIARCNLVKGMRAPKRVVVCLLSSILLLLLFDYVFGSVVAVPAGSYREFFLPGILTCSMVFTCTTTSTTLAAELRGGTVDRIRALPTSRGTVLVGRTVSDLVTGALVVTAISSAGLAIGWRPHASVWSVLAGYAVLYGFAFAFSWLTLVAAFLARGRNAGFFALLPTAAIARTFVDTTHFPVPLRTVADWNPISAVAESTRTLLSDATALRSTAPSWPMQHPIVASLAWTTALLVLFVPVALSVYADPSGRIRSTASSPERTPG